MRPKNVISFQFPDDATKTVPCDFKMPASEVLRFLFEDEECKRWSGCYLYDGGKSHTSSANPFPSLFPPSHLFLFLDTKLDHSLSFIEQGVRVNSTVFFRQNDMAPLQKKKQANLTNYVCTLALAHFHTFTLTCPFFVVAIVN
jgi:hypothetical protein